MNKKKFDIGKLISDNVAWFVLLLLVIFFGIFSENFFSLRNIMNLLSQNAYLLIASIGITFVMMSSGMDLSVGYVMSTMGVVGAKLLVDVGLPSWLVIILMIVITVAIELLFVPFTRCISIVIRNFTEQSPVPTQAPF